MPFWKKKEPELFDLGASADIEVATPPEPPSGDLVLEAAGPRLILVIKTLREFTGLGLAEAKQLAESAPTAVPVPADRVAEVAAALRVAGATVTVRRAAPAPAPAEGDLVEDLERLVALRDSGALTPEEFETAKARVLAGE